jgi:hypothetical protein
MKQIWLKVYRTLILSTMVITACHPSPGKMTVVTGKTVYGDLAMEDVTIETHMWEESGWKYLGKTRSGYHGSFRLHLSPGEYRITARKTIRRGQGEVLVTGILEDLKVEKPGGRIDRVVILLVPARGP